MARLTRKELNAAKQSRFFERNEWGQREDGL